MASKKIDADATRHLAEARRRAEEARRRAEAEARHRAELARQAAQARAQQRLQRDEVSSGRGTALHVKALGLTGASHQLPQLAHDGPTVPAKDVIRSGGQRASSLLTEDANDASVNCLDRAADHVKALTPDERRQAQLVVLDDTRPGAEGTTGHVVVRDGRGGVTDPTSGQRYGSTEAYLKANPQYREAGAVRGPDAEAIFATAPGSPERAAALDRAGVPQSLREARVADATPGYTKADAERDAERLHDAVDGLGTDEKKIWSTLDGRTKEDLDQIRAAYTRRFGGSLDADIKNDLSGDELDRAKDLLAGHDPRVNDVRSATRALDDANEKVRDLDQQLAEQLQGLEKGLTETQRAAYIAKFRDDPKHKALYEAREQKAKALADSLEKNKAALQRAAASNPKDAAELKKALDGLAGTSQAKAALDFIKDAPKASLDALGGKKFVEGLFQKAAPQVVGGLLAAGASPDDAFKQFAELTNQLKPALDAYGAWGQVQEGLEAIASVKDTGSFDRLKQLTQGWNSSNPVVKGLAVAGLVIGGAQAVQKGREGEYQAALKEIAGAGRGGLELLAGVTNSLSEAGKLARFGVDGAQAARFGTFATRLAPALGLAASALSLSLRANDIKKGDADAGTYVAIAGDAIGVLGAAVELVPGGQPVGLVISGIGAATSAAGELVSNIIKLDQTRDARKKYLEQIGIGEPLRSAAAVGSPQFDRLTTKLGLTPEQLQAAVKAKPGLLESSHLTEFSEALESRGLTGEKALRFISAVDAKTLEHFATWSEAYLERSAPTFGKRDAVDSLLRQYRKEHPEHAAALERAGLDVP